MAAAVCFTSCKNEAKNAPAKDGEKTEVKAEEQAAPAAEEKVALIGEAGKLMEKYKDLEAQMTEFGKLIEGNPIAKKLNDDKAFEEEVKKELGLEDIDF